MGYRDTSQDVMAWSYTNPAKVRQRITELLNGQVSMGYGLHLFDPEWFHPAAKAKIQKSHDRACTGQIELHPRTDQACSDDHLWLIPSICDYVKETGDTAFFDEVIPYCDKGEATVWDHMKAALDFSAKKVGPTGICIGLRADWNDCLNLGGGESAMV